MEPVDINTIQNQLNYLDETKEEIRQALINKRTGCDNSSDI